MSMLKLTTIATFHSSTKYSTHENQDYNILWYFISELNCKILFLYPLSLNNWRSFVSVAISSNDVSCEISVQQYLLSITHLNDSVYKCKSEKSIFDVLFFVNDLFVWSFIFNSSIRVSSNSSKYVLNYSLIIHKNILTSLNINLFLFSFKSFFNII